MTTTHFKLTEPNGFTRRVTFSEQPTWKALSTRIELLYGIPVERVSVSYLDADNDQVTLSSQDELDDYYLNLHQPGRAIKFTVQDLTSARLQRNIQTHPQTTNFRNTFGFDIDEDWQNLVIPPITDLGGFFNAASHDKVDSRGFIEVVESHSSVDDDAQHDLDHRSSSPSSMQSSPNSPFMIPLDKGKGRATAFDGVSSTASLLGEDAPPKHPVHVYDLSHLDSDPSAAPFSAPTVPAVSAPKVTTPDVILEPAAAAKDIAPPAEDDPPLPSIEEETTSTPTPQESPSLSSDIAAFMHTLTNVVASHPELSEGIRNIVRNASSGAYWHAHREAISRAAQDITQESGRITQNLRRETEEEAGRHVAEALGGVFRSLSQTLSGQPSVSHPVTPDATAPPNTENNGATGTADVPPGPVFADTVHPQPQLPPRPPFNPWVHRSMSFGHWGQGSPRAPFGGPPIPPPPVPMPTGWHGWVPPPGPPPPPPPPSNPPPPHTLGAQELRAQVDAAKARYKAEKERYRIEREERRKERERRAKMVADEPVAPVLPATATATPWPPIPATSDAQDKDKPTATAEVAAPWPPIPAAIAVQGKADKSTTAVEVGSSWPPIPAAIAVQGRGGRPTHEVVSVQRHHTHLGHGSSSWRHGNKNTGSTDLKSRAVSRITRRLADMGFTENAYPDLPSKIKAEVPSDGSTTKEGEDNIVTTLLEELLAMSPKPSAPVASGSLSRDIPGSWH